VISVKFNSFQKEWLIKAGLAILVSGMCLGGLILPALQESAVLRAKIFEAKKFAALLYEVRQLEEKIMVLESPLAFWTDRSMMMSKVADFANKNGLEVQTLVPRTAKEGGYVRLGIEMRAFGDFFESLKFLKGLETFEPPVRVTEVSLSRARGRTGGRELNVTLLLESYLKQPHEKKKI